MLEYKIKAKVAKVELGTRGRINYESACDLSIKLDKLKVPYDIIEFEKVEGKPEVRRELTKRELIASVIV